MARSAAESVDSGRAGCGIHLSGNLCVVYDRANTNALGHTLVSLDIVQPRASGRHILTKSVAGSSRMV
jgi:hypothetical protein